MKAKTKTEPLNVLLKRTLIIEFEFTKIYNEIYGCSIKSQVQIYY